MALLRRWGRRFFVRLRYLPCALLALGEAFLHCWMLLLFAFLAPLLLALSGQGRQALLVSADPEDEFDSGRCLSYVFGDTDRITRAAHY